MTLQEVFDLGDDRGEDMQQGGSRAASQITMTRLAMAASMLAAIATFRLSGDAIASASVCVATLCVALILAWRK